MEDNKRYESDRVIKNIDSDVFDEYYEDDETILDEDYFDECILNDQEEFLDEIKRVIISFRSDCSIPIAENTEKKYYTILDRMMSELENS